MAAKTTNLGLTKPVEDEFYDISVQNGNMDIIDKEIGELKNPTFTSADVADGSATSWTTVAKLASKESKTSIFAKVSQMFKNVRYLYKMLGSTDISKIGNGTCTGAISTLKTTLDGKASNTHNHDDRYYTETEIDSKLKVINEGVSSVNQSLAITTSNLSMASGLGTYISLAKVLKTGNTKNLLIYITPPSTATGSFKAGESNNLCILPDGFRPTSVFRKEFTIKDGALRAYLEINPSDGIVSIVFRDAADIRYLSILINEVFI